MTQSVDPLEDPLLRDVTVVDGRKQLDSCRITGWLGKGGMGNVYRAHHRGFDFEVALKCLNPALSASDPNFVEKFRREARLAATLTHTNLIRVYSVGEEHGIHFIVMELVEGESLAERIKRTGALEPDEARRIIHLAAEGLAVAHRANVVHRDIKPGNIMLSTKGEVKLADLGLAKAVDAAEELTATAVAMGTPAYMPPEQWYDARSVGTAGDVYALGATWYCALAGRAPFGGKSPEIMRRACAGDFPDVREAVGGVPDATAALIARCTALEPVDRFRDATELLAALGEAPPPASVARPAREAPSEPEGTRVLETGIPSRPPGDGTRVEPPGGSTESEGDAAPDETVRERVPEQPARRTEPAGGETTAGDVFGGADSDVSAAPPVRTRSRSARPLVIGAAAVLVLALGAFAVTQLVGGSAEGPVVPAEISNETAGDPPEAPGATELPDGESASALGGGGDTSATTPGDTARAATSSPTPPEETGEAHGADPSVTREFAINTSPRAATLYVDGERVQDDGFGTYDVPLTEGIHIFRVVPRDGMPEATFEYVFSPEQNRRRILLDYAAGTISDSE